MQKNYKYTIFSLGSLAIIITLLTVTSPTAQAQTLIDTTAATGISTSIDATSAVTPIKIREQIRTTTQTKVQNVKNTQELKPILIASTTKARMMNANENAYERLKALREKADKEVNDKNKILASTTRKIMEKEREKLQEREKEYRDNGKKMVFNAFKVRKVAIVGQLQVAINNLVQVRDRINSRIQKIQEDNNKTSNPTREKWQNRDMTEAIQLLAVADTKIAAAKEAVKLVMDYAPNASTTVITNIQAVTGTTQTSTQEQVVNLDDARQLINNAHIAIKDAQKALNKVIVAIAKASGLEIGRPASTTSKASIEVR